MLPAGQRREIFLGGSIQVLEGGSRNQLPDIDRDVDRLLRASPRAHSLAAVLERRLYEDDRGGEALLMLERQIAGGDGSTEPRAKRIVERLEDIVQVVRMAGDERLVERFATQRVDDAVERRHAGADSARRFHERRRRRAVRNMEDANATRSDKANQLTEKRKAIGRCHPLKDAIAVDEIELAAGARVINEELGRRLEFDVGGSLAIGLAPGGREHGGRPIDGGDSSRPPRERDGEAADAAAVLQRGHGREFRNEAQAHEAQQPLDVHLAAREELPLAIRRHVRAQVLRGRQHGEVRLARGERLPSPVGFAARATCAVHQGRIDAIISAIRGILLSCRESISDKGLSSLLWPP